MSVRIRSSCSTASSRRPAARCCAPSVSRTAISRKPQVGIASTWSKLTPCNMHIDKLAAAAAKGADAAGGKSTIFDTITVSDGISMGTPGMRYSLVSREVIADSIETAVGAQGFDGVVAHRRLRQEHARLHDGDRAAQPAGGVRLWRHDPARAKSSATSSPSSKRSARTRRARSTTSSCAKSSAPRFRARAAAAACTRPTRWRRRSKRSA